MKLNKHVSLAILAAGMMTFACGGGGNETQKSGESTTTAPVEQKQAPGEKNKDNPDFVKGLALVKENDCPSCHMVERKIVGPSYAEVAEKYEYNDENIEMLASHVIAGNVGVWGEIPMPAHPNLSKEDAEQMVKYVLLLK